MPPTDDMGLLREYAWGHAEEAFATLVTRHIDLVYSAALRHVGNHHQAEEITQAVFVILARKARSLGPGTVLAGWLFRTARLTAANYLRTETRRARREQEAFMQSEPTENRGDPWQEVAPLLNDAIAALAEGDRNAIVLRFLQGKDYKQVAAALGGTEAAAHMRVSRALEKLRKLFARRGVVASAGALGAVLTANAAQAAPAGLAASVCAAAVQGTTTTASTLALVKGTLKLMAWTKTKLAIGASVVVMVAYQHLQYSSQAQQLAAAREDVRLKAEAAAAQQSRLAELQQQNNSISSTRREMEQELARLRARRKATNPSAPAAATGRTLLSAVLQDPAERELLRQNLLVGLRNRWAPLTRELNLDNQAAEKLVQIGGDGYLKNLEAVAAFTDGKVTAAAAVQAGDGAKAKALDELRSWLGEAGLARYEECERSYPARLLTEQFDKQQGFYAIHELQRQRLFDLIAAQPPEVAAALAGDMNVRDVVFPDALNRLFEQEQAANQQILQAAAAFLEPEQLQALGSMQTLNLSNHKRNVLRFLRKL